MNQPSKGVPSDSSTPKVNPPSESAAALPIPIKCKAKAITGVVAYAACITMSPEGCPHLISFANGKLCQHPSQTRIVARTQELDSKNE